MSVFKYRMQNILNIKNKLEEQAKNEFAQANLRVAAEEERLMELKEKKKLLENEVKKLLETVPLNVQEILLNKSGILKKEEEIQAQQRALTRAKELLEEKRQMLMEVRMERKTHEILKENAFAEFVKEERAAESKEIDQLTSYTYGKKADRK